MLAAQANRVAVVEELIHRGADVNARDFNGNTVLDYARAGNSQDVVAALQVHLHK
jgi:ankyrin repeat protein